MRDRQANRPTERQRVPRENKLQIKKLYYDFYTIIIYQIRIEMKRGMLQQNISHVEEVKIIKNVWLYFRIKFPYRKYFYECIRY